MTSAPSIQDLRGVATADVYKSGSLAGTLTREGDDTVFSYRPDYLTSAAAEEVASTLPLSSTPVRSTGGSVPPFFAGLLPEGLRLSAIVSATRTSEDDQLTLLLSVGSDAIGDVQVVASGTAPERPTAALSGTEEVASFAEIFARATSSDPSVIERIALPGVQDKVSTGVISTPMITTRGPAILKLGSSRFPRIVENENFFLSMARACGIPTPDHEILHDSRGQSGLLVSRFDRVVTASGDRALPQEDACQVLGRYPSAKYRISLEESVRGLSSAVSRRQGSGRLTTRKALEIAAFSYLVGNGDLHAKNLSIYRDRRDVWGLTPAYDLLTTQPYFSWRDPMAVPLFGRANRLGRRWWLDAATRLGIPPKSLATRLDALIATAPGWLDRLVEIGFDDKATNRLRQLIADRIDELAP